MHVKQSLDRLPHSRSDSNDPIESRGDAEYSDEKMSGVDEDSAARHMQGDYGDEQVLHYQSEEEPPLSDYGDEEMYGEEEDRYDE